MNCLQQAATKSIHALFERQAAETPQAIAVECQGAQMTYRQLSGQSNRLAHFLRRQGVSPEVPVGIFLDRSIDLAVTLLAILKSGGFYVPLDPSYPADRLRFMLQDTSISVVITRGELGNELRHIYSGIVVDLAGQAAKIDQESGESPEDVIHPENVAYVVYTSGSTGRPKGVGIRHSSAAVLMEWTHQVFATEDLAAVLASTSMCFDLSVFEIFAPLTCGGRVVLVKNALELGELPERANITLINTVPSAIAELLGTPGIPASVKVVNLAGEALHHDLVKRIHDQSSIRQLFNLYGPSEDTTYSTCILLERDRSSAEVPIGKPILNTRAHVLDEHGDECEGTAIGELYLGGDGLARGYLGRPGLTAERFVPDSFSGQPGQRLYRTGDFVYQGKDGNLGFTGRADQQVKIRGFRIELGEIEIALGANSGIEKAAVLAPVNQKGDKHLVAYVVKRPDVSLTANDLRQYLKQRVPAHMVPQSFVFLDHMPLTLNGKINRQALPAPSEAAGALAPYAHPESETQRLLTDIWCEVFGLSEIGIRDDFFDLGGHSLLATRILARVARIFHARIAVPELFESPTIEQFEKAVETALKTELPLPVLVGPRFSGGTFPLTRAQEGLWILNQLYPDYPLNSVVEAVRFRGVLNTGALQSSINQLIQRHESLRTRIISREGNPEQQVMAWRETSLSVLDLTDQPEAQRPRLAQRVLEREAEHLFRLDEGPLFRCSLLRLDAEEHILVLNVHHAVTDGWSQEILWKELRCFYEGHSAGKPAILPAPIRYADCVFWEQEELKTERIREQVAFWTQKLADPPVHEIKTGRQRPPLPTFGGAMNLVRIDKDLTQSLRELAQEEGVTLFMVLFALFNVLLHRYSGQDDIVVGTPIAGRKTVEMENVVGMFTNVLPLRTNLANSARFRDLLAEVRKTTVEAYRNQDVPMEEVTNQLQLNRDLSHHPLYQAIFGLQVEPFSAPDIAGLQITPVFVDPGVASSSELLFSLTEVDGELRGYVQYNTDVFTKEMIHVLVGHYQALAAYAVHDPAFKIDGVPLLNRSELDQLTAWNSTGVSDPGCCLHELFEQQAAKTPGSVALVCEGRELSYGELEQRANQLANFLISHGAWPEERIGICMERRFSMVTAMLAVMKAGGAYVAMDPKYPRSHREFVIADAGCALVITDMLSEPPPASVRIININRESEEIGEQSISRPRSVLRPENLAYVIYTSGSTGHPKGVGISHRSAACMVQWAKSVFTAEELSGTLASTSICFDLSVFEIFVPLSIGGQVIIVQDALSLPAQDLDRISLINTVPSAMVALLHSGNLPTSVRVVNLAGEALERSLVKEVYEQSDVHRVFNLYGPSEDTTYSTYACLINDQDTTAPSIGGPCSGTRIHILDKEMNLLPIGLTGDLYISGTGLARGYLGRPGLTAERFIPLPFAAKGGERMYRTGDLARWRPDGNLEFLGRSDHQVKLRGFRIELGEIESVLRQQANVKEAVVTVNDGTLAAYIVEHESGKIADGRAFEKLLAKKLPGYMVPNAYVFLDKMPLTRNGKVDRKALPNPLYEAPANILQPRTSTEERLCRIWVEVLRVKTVGVREGFFEMGGHSLLATRVLARVLDEWGVDLPVHCVFQFPTVEGLAQHIDSVISDPSFQPGLSGARVKRELSIEEVLASMDSLSEQEVETLLSLSSQTD